jgi:hypothetical protein
MQRRYILRVLARIAGLKRMIWMSKQRRKRARDGTTDPEADNEYLERLLREEARDLTDEEELAIFDDMAPFGETDYDGMKFED